MNNIEIVESTIGLEIRLTERKQALMVQKAIELYLTVVAKLKKFGDDPDNYILQDFGNELEEYLHREQVPVFDDDYIKK